MVAEQADAMRWAADAMLSGWSLTAVADELTGRGHRRAGRAAAQVDAVHPQVTDGRRSAGAPGQILGPGNWTPILPKDAWQSVRARLSGPRTIRRRDGRDYPVSEAVFAGNDGRTGRRYELTAGLAVCGVCGAPLTGCRVKRAGTVPYLRCQPSKGGRACVGILMQPTDNTLPTGCSPSSTSRRSCPRSRLTSTRTTGRARPALSALDGQRGELARIWAAGGMSTRSGTRRGPGSTSGSRRYGLSSGAARGPRAAGGDRGRAGGVAGMTLDERREFLRLFVARVVVDRAPAGRRAAIEERVTVEWRSAR